MCVYSKVDMSKSLKTAITQAGGIFKCEHEGNTYIQLDNKVVVAIENRSYGINPYYTEVVMYLEDSARTFMPIRLSLTKEDGTKRKYSEIVEMIIPVLESFIIKVDTFIIDRTQREELEAKKRQDTESQLKKLNIIAKESGYRNGSVTFDKIGNVNLNLTVSEYLSLMEGVKINEMG
jgi:hypothetical protein